MLSFSELKGCQRFFTYLVSVMMYVPAALYLPSCEKKVDMLSISVQSGTLRSLINNRLFRALKFIKGIC